MMLSMIFKMLINNKIVKINEILRFKSLKSVIYLASKCFNANNILTFKSRINFMLS